ncbi:hypothetical protein K9N68_32785 [Kovacikia minuta CCNUW1]|uniref:hypothetical protein n=1 Tax=Kovacikia minuta TaxID=2931930 RepID=UPI001CCE4B2D|nr:hypothetical protein [Kovacikia minuta]UBF26232.1 hypothetical protein K9N68_32785 [Kovacikia minuta CCNUW1]
MKTFGQTPLPDLSRFQFKLVSETNGIWETNDRPLWNLLDLQPQHNAQNDLNGNVVVNSRHLTPGWV